MQFVQTVITDEQAALLSAAARVAAEQSEELISEEERDEFARLAVFWAAVAGEPSRFVPTGKAADTVKKIVRAAKGPAQRPSRKNKRKARQERRMSFHKRRRKERAEAVAAYNEAYARVQAEVAEMEEIQAARMAELESQPKFNVVLDGQVVLQGVPESLIQVVPAEQLLDADDHAVIAEEEKPQVYLGVKAEMELERGAA